MASADGRGVLMIHVVA